jgi:hypothetical protein
MRRSVAQTGAAPASTCSGTRALPKTVAGLHFLAFACPMLTDVANIFHS